MLRAVVAVAATLLFVSLALNPIAAYSQASKPPLAPLGPRTSDLNMTTRLNEAAERNRDSIGTLLFSYLGSGDFRTVMKKTNPQGLFFTLEVDGTQVKNVARGKKLKVEEAVEHGELRVLAKLSRPGRRLSAVCKADMAVGFRQVIFLPYGGEEGYFSCHILEATHGRVFPSLIIANLSLSHSSTHISGGHSLSIAAKFNSKRRHSHLLEHGPTTFYADPASSQC